MGLRKRVRSGGGDGTIELACRFCSSRHGRSRPLQLLRRCRLYRRKWCRWCALGDCLSAVGEGEWVVRDCLWHSWRFLLVCTAPWGGRWGRSAWGAESEWKLWSLQTTTTMGDVDETARLWRVNRTVHELVRDRVRPRCSLRPPLTLF